MDSLLNTSGQQLPNNHFVDAQVNWRSIDRRGEIDIARKKFSPRQVSFLFLAKYQKKVNRWMLLGDLWVILLFVQHNCTCKPANLYGCGDVFSISLFDVGNCFAVYFVEFHDESLKEVVWSFAQHFNFSLKIWTFTMHVNILIEVNAIVRSQKQPPQSQSQPSTVSMQLQYQKAFHANAQCE